MKIPSLKRTKLSTVATLGVVFILGTAIIIIAVVSIAAIRGAGLYSLQETKKAISEEALNLVNENTRRMAKEYSEVFVEGLELVKLISNQAILILSSKDKFNFPEEAIEKLSRQYKRSANNMPYIYHDNANVTLSAVADYIMEDKIKDEVYLLSRLFPLLHVVQKSTKGYYQTWLWDYANYIQNTTYTSKFPPIEIPDTKAYKEVVDKAYIYNKNFPRVNIFGVYKDVYGPMVLSLTSSIYNDRYKITGGIDLLFREVVKKILSNKIPLIDTSNPNIQGSGLGSFIVGYSAGEVMAMQQSLYNKLKLPVRDFKQFNLFHFIKVKLQNSKIDKIKGFAKTIKNEKSGYFFFKSENEEYLISYQRMNVKDWVFGVVVPVKGLYSVVYETENRMEVTVSGFIVNFIMVSMFFLFILLIVVVLFFKAYLVKPIVAFRDNVLRIGKGDLNTVIKEHGVYEVAVLSRAFETLRKRLKKHIANFEEEVTQRQRTENELKVARQVQLSVLPKITSLFKNRGIELFAKLLPAKDVAGDYYDFFFIGKDRLVLIMGDVSGKGISASFYMAVTKRTLRNTCISEPDDPAKAIYLANNILCSYNLNKFVTLFLIYYDLNTGEIIYANGGHNEAVNLKSNGTVDIFGCLNNTALGCFPDLPFVNATYKLNKDDTLFLYTDGIVEANKEDENFYGMDRFTDLLIKNRDESIEKICKIVIQDVHVFEAGGQFDDITILAIRKVE